jgi:hypothetical protein
MRIGRFVLCAGLLLVVFALIHGEVRAREMEISYEEGYLSVLLEDADLERVLTVVAEKTGISLDLPEDLKQVVTVEFDRISLEEGLYRILRDVNHVLIFSPSEGQGAGETVSGVYIPSEEFKRRGSQRSAPARPARVNRERDEEEEEDLEEEDLIDPGELDEEEEPEDPILERYERQLDLLEQQMETVEEDSPQGQAITSKMRRLQSQIETRLEQLERQEAQ